MRPFRIVYHLTGGERIDGPSIQAENSEEAMAQAVQTLTAPPRVDSPPDLPLLTITTSDRSRSTAVLKSSILGVTVQPSA